MPNGLAAISKVPAAGWGQILAYMAFCEVSQDQSPGTPAAAGDFGFKVLTSSDPAEKTKKLSAELANGRLAMMAIIGMFFQVPAQHMNRLFFCIYCDTFSLGPSWVAKGVTWCDNLLSSMQSSSELPDLKLFLLFECLRSMILKDRFCAGWSDWKCMG